MQSRKIIKQKLIRTKQLKENQSYFFILQQAINLPSGVKELIDSYLYIILYIDIEIIDSSIEKHLLLLRVPPDLRITEY